MTTITITEGLAELPTILKRIAKKQEVIEGFLFRQAVVRDPHEKEGGSAAVIDKEFQGIADLTTRYIMIRSAIQRANSMNMITIKNTTMTIADWLVWRRELAQGNQQFHQRLFNKLNNLRSKAQQQGFQVSEKIPDGFTQDYVVNINEKKLSETIETNEEILGLLDGQLSLKNATITIEV